MTPIVIAEHVFKRYTAPPTFAINQLFQSVSLGLRRVARPTPQAVPRFVLKDVNFTLERGEALGVIGSNGAGKTTLFRLLAGISLPTQGRIRVEGHVSSLITLGAGFHPDLSGRENLVLNCTLLGLSRKETAARIDQIITFAELADDIDVAVKRYSSGMLARLGFSVAVHLDPELILIDEVLAVGDYRFQVKSTAALRDFIQRGTVILVSHDLAAIERICKRALWLDQGEIKADGPSSEVIACYIDAQQRAMLQTEQADANAELKQRSDDLFRVERLVFDDTVQVVSVAVYDGALKPATQFNTGDTLIVECELRFGMPTGDVRVVVGLADIDSRVVVISADNRQCDQPSVLHGSIHIECRFTDIPLRPRKFGVYVEISNAKALMPLYLWKDLDTRFVVSAERFSVAAGLVQVPGVEMRFSQESGG